MTEISISEGKSMENLSGTLEIAEKVKEVAKRVTEASK